jgi:predicted O-methyltransferase YrrM
VSDKNSNWKFAEELVPEDDVTARARALSLELGVEAVSPAVGAQCAVIAAASAAKTIAEIGTGVGVSGLYLLSGATNAVLTSIDAEFDYQQHARSFFTEAGIAANRLRLITGFAREVLPRMNENSYDLVLVDGDPLCVIEFVENALRLVRQGGTVLVPHALWRGRVANPALRDDVATAFRTLATEIATSGAVVSALSPAGDGLLQITKRRA